MLRFTRFILPVFIVIILQADTLTQEKGIIYSPCSDSIELSIADKLLVDSAFDYIKDLDFVNYNDCNNCDSRAHLIAAILENRFPALSIAKVWLFADFKRSSQEEKYKYKKYVYLSAGNECDGWGFHVAPAFVIKNAGSVDTIVLDPSTQTKPISLSRWALDLTPRRESTYLIIKDKKYYTFPDNENKKFEDLKNNWAVDENSLDDDYSKSIKKILKSKHGIREHWLFSSEIKKIMDLLSGGEDEN